MTKSQFQMAILNVVSNQASLSYKQDASQARYHAIRQGIWIQGDHSTYSENPVIMAIIRFAEKGNPQFGSCTLGDLISLEQAWEYYQANENKKEPLPDWADPPIPPQ